jgi:hypothetical protein
MHVFLHMLLFPKSPRLPPVIAEAARGAPGGSLDSMGGVFIDNQVSTWTGSSGNSQSPEK